MQVNEIVLHGRQNHHTAGSTFQLKLEDLVMCLSHCVIIRIHGYDLFSAQCPVYKLWLLLYWHRYTVMFLFITVLQISSCHSLNHLEFFVKLLAILYIAIITLFLDLFRLPGRVMTGQHAKPFVSFPYWMPKRDYSRDGKPELQIFGYGIFTSPGAFSKPFWLII